MLFTIIVLAVVAALVVYATKKKKTTVPTSTFVETITPSIHEEIAKTVKETKTQAPIANEVSKPKAKKTAPKAAKVETSSPAPTMSAKKKVASQAKK
jgi:hypothetical protein